MRQSRLNVRLGLWIGILLLGLIFLQPVIWQWCYEERLLHVVGVGSTKKDYWRALQSNQLGNGFPKLGYTFHRPIEYHGSIYTIFAVPAWDDTGHLSGYKVFSELSIRGHAFYLSHPQFPGEKIF